MSDGTQNDRVPGRRSKAIRGLYLVVVLLGVWTIGTMVYLSNEVDPGWDGMFLYTCLAFGWAFTAVAFQNSRRAQPNPVALWFSFGLFVLFGLGAFFGIMGYWLVMEDEIYPTTFITLLLVVVTSGVMLYSITEMLPREDRPAPATQGLAPPPVEPTTAPLAAGWHADPTGSHAERFHDGHRWTGRVRDGDVVGQDPL